MSSSGEPTSGICMWASLWWSRASTSRRCRLPQRCSYVLVHQAAHDAQEDRPEAFAGLAGLVGLI
jgi:hypothetical protein